jgi:predicted Zn-dependent protease
MQINSMRRILFFLSFVLLISSCTKNSVTNRSQMTLLPESDLQQMSMKEYSNFLKSHKVMPDTAQFTKLVKKTGNRIVSAITAHLAEQGKSDLLKGYKWEFNLVQDSLVNAWCMPGGKVVVYTGLLKVTQNESALAIVMGHEIAHAVAQHGNERMSQELMRQAGGAALSVFMVNQPSATQDIFMTSYGLATEVGAILPFSRKQELEADRFGCRFAAMAGYNVDEAIPFWQRMAKAGPGAQKSEEWMSTHPADETRIQKMGEYVAEAKKYYKPAPMTQTGK